MMEMERREEGNGGGGGAEEGRARVAVEREAALGARN